MRKSAPDVALIVVVITLTIIGVVMVHSASAVRAHHDFLDPFFFSKRQALFAFFGVLAMLVMAKVDYQIFWKYSELLLFVCFLLLIAVLVPGIGLIRGGARSWIGIGAFSIQPSEFMKFGMIAFISKYVVKKRKKLGNFGTGLLPILLLLAFVFGLIMLQPDLGTGTVLMSVCLVLLFVAGTPGKYFAFLGGLGALGFFWLNHFCSLSNQANYFFFKSMGRPIRQWLSNDSISPSHWPRWIVWTRLWTK